MHDDFDDSSVQLGGFRLKLEAFNLSLEAAEPPPQPLGGGGGGGGFRVWGLGFRV